jgi:hypothetical protein
MKTIYRLNTIFIFSFLLVLYQSVVNAQIYNDLLCSKSMTPSVLMLAGEEMQKTNDNLSAIHKTQILIATELAEVNELQNTIQKGLKTVSSIIKDALVVKEIKELSQDIYDEMDEVATLAEKYPLYAGFATDYIQDFYTRATSLVAEISALFTENDTDLMDAGQRHKLLDHIRTELRILHGTSYGMNICIKAAVNNGLLKSLASYSSWISQDRAIVDEILTNATRLKF